MGIRVRGGKVCSLSESVEICTGFGGEVDWCAGALRLSESILESGKIRERRRLSTGESSGVKKKVRCLITELISSEVTENLSLDPHCSICFRTNFKEMPCIPPRDGLAQILI